MKNEEFASCIAGAGSYDTSSINRPSRTQVRYRYSKSGLTPMQLSINLRKDVEPYPQSTGGFLNGYNIEERRQKRRFSIPFIVKARGIDTRGQAFEMYTLLEDISASGLYLQLPRQVEPGSKLFMIVRLSTYATEESSGARIAVRGVVLRTEPRQGGLWGLALRFTSHRFLSYSCGTDSSNEVGNNGPV